SDGRAYSKTMYRPQLEVLLVHDEYVGARVGRALEGFRNRNRRGDDRVALGSGMRPYVAADPKEVSAWSTATRACSETMQRTLSPGLTGSKSRNLKPLSGAESSRWNDTSTRLRPCLASSTISRARSDGPPRCLSGALQGVVQALTGSRRTSFALTGAVAPTAM